MHDCALEQIRERGMYSAPRVEHTRYCSEISTKTKLQNHIKIIITPNIYKHILTTQGFVKNAYEVEYSIKAY